MSSIRHIIRYPHGTKAFYHRKVTLCLQKNAKKICICAKFVVPLQRILKKQIININKSY